MAEPTLLMTAIRPFALSRSRGALISSLLARGWRVIVASSRGGHEELQELGAKFHHVPYARGGPAPVADSAALWALRHIIRSNRPEIVQAFHGKPVIAASLATLGTDSKLCVTATGLGQLVLGSGLVSRMGRGVYALALKRADLVVFQNPDDRALFTKQSRLADPSWRIIPGSGVDTDLFRPRAELKHGGDPVRVLMLARLIREKGVLEFLEAAKLLRERGVEARIQLGGEWDAHPNAVAPRVVEHAVSQGWVEFIGYVPDVEALLPETDILVLPSYREGIPRILLEGAACAAALVTSDVSGCREVVRHEETGLLVSPRDPVALADALARLVGDPDLRHQLGAAARERVVCHFSMTSITQQYLACYAELVPSLGRGPPGVP